MADYVASKGEAEILERVCSRMRKKGIKSPKYMIQMLEYLEDELEAAEASLAETEKKLKVSSLMYLTGLIAGSWICPLPWMRLSDSAGNRFRFPLLIPVRRLRWSSPPYGSISRAPGRPVGGDRFSAPKSTGPPPHAHARGQ